MLVVSEVEAQPSWLGLYEGGLVHPRCLGHPFLEGSWHMVVDIESIFGDVTKIQDLTAF